MQIQLNEQFTNFLTEQPETGMGYQYVRIKLKTGQYIMGMVYSCSILDTKEKNRRIGR